MNNKLQQAIREIYCYAHAANWISEEQLQPINRILDVCREYIDIAEIEAELGEVKCSNINTEIPRETRTTLGGELVGFKGPPQTDFKLEFTEHDVGKWVPLSNTINIRYVLNDDKLLVTGLEVLGAMEDGFVNVIRQMIISRRHKDDG